MLLWWWRRRRRLVLVTHWKSEYKLNLKLECKNGWEVKEGRWFPGDGDGRPRVYKK